MKRNILALFFLSSCSFCNGQITQLTDPSNQYCGNPNNNGIGTYPSSRGKFITPYTFNRLLRKDFSLITTNEEGLPSIGNYASLKLSDNDTKLTLNGSLYNIGIKKDSIKPIKTILSFGIKAGLQDGIATLFSNTSVNNNVGLNAQYSILNWKRSRYEYRAVDCGVLAIRRDLLRVQFLNEQRKLEIKRDLLSHQVDELRETRRKVDEAADDLKMKIVCEAMSGNPIVALSLAEEQLEQRSFAVFDSIVMLRNDYAQTFVSAKTNADTLEKKYLQKLYDLESKDIKWTSFRIQWIDIVGNITGNSYKLFKRSNPVDSQVIKKNFEKFQVGFNFNIFHSDPEKSFLKYGYLFKISYRIGNDNNLKEAKKRDIESIILIDTPSFTRRVIEKVSAYDQVFKQTFSHTIGFQFTKFLNEKRNYGISLYTNCVLAYNEFWKFLKIDGKPEISIGPGFFITLLDKEKETATVNFELQARFLDILNSGDDKNHFFDRNEIALKIGLPFQSIFLNQKK